MKKNGILKLLDLLQIEFVALKVDRVMVLLLVVGVNLASLNGLFWRRYDLMLMLLIMIIMMIMRLAIKPWVVCLLIVN